MGTCPRGIVGVKHDATSAIRLVNDIVTLVTIRADDRSALARRGGLPMNSGRSWTWRSLHLAGMLVIGACPGAPAQELRIGFLAPMTGIFAQLGTDKVNGFQMYLEEHN